MTMNPESFLNVSAPKPIVPLNGQSSTSIQPEHPIGHLAEALAAARDKCKAAPKEAVNTFHHYRYASADDVIGTASEAMRGTGLSPLMPLCTRLTVLGTGNSAIYALDRTFLLAHSSGESLVLLVEGWPVIPERGRPLDKAYAIAQTTSLAYAYRDLLQMPRGTDDDMSARNDTQAAPTPPPQASAETDGSDPTPPAQEAVLTQEEYNQIVSLARQHKRNVGEVSAICAAMGVPVLERAPQSRLSWLQQAVTTGLVSTPEKDAISNLIDSLLLPWPPVQARLQQRYGVSSLAHLLPHQAQELKELLQKELAQRQTQARLAQPVN